VNACFCCVRFFCTEPTDWLGERFWHDLFFVKWDVKPPLNHGRCRYDDGRGAAVDEDEGRDRYEDDGGRRRPRGRRSESDGGDSDMHPLVVMVVASIDWLYRSPSELECGPMPSVIAALPNIGGALCSSPQSLADAQY